MKSKSISEEKQETGGDSDSRHVPSYPFEPEADDSEIVTAKVFLQSQSLRQSHISLHVIMTVIIKRIFTSYV